jgi:sugar phosphate isomerase/epimerase
MEPQDWRDLLSSCQGLSLSFSPGDCLWLGIDYLAVLSHFAAAIENIEGADVEIDREMLKDSGMYGPLWWRYRLVGKGKVDWAQLIELLKLYEFKGTFSLRFDDEFIYGDQAQMEDALDQCIAKIAPLIKL